MTKENFYLLVSTLEEIRDELLQIKIERCEYRMFNETTSLCGIIIGRRKLYVSIELYSQLEKHLMDYYFKK